LQSFRIDASFFTSLVPVFGFVKVISPIVPFQFNYAVLSCHNS
jgi:hypothetical protein